MGPELLLQHSYLQIDFYSTLELEESPKKIVFFNIRTSCDFLVRMTHSYFLWGGRTRQRTHRVLFKTLFVFAKGILATSQLDHTNVQLHVYSKHFLFLSTVPIIKAEPTDDYEPAQTCGPRNQGLSPLSKPYYSQQIMMPPDPGSCLVAGFTSCQQRNTVMSSSPSSSPKLHDLSSPAYKCITNPGHSHLGLQQTVGGVPTIQEVPRSIVVHPSSPDQSSHIMLQPQVSQHLSSSLGYQQTLYPNSPSSPVPSVTQEPTYLQSCSPTHSSIMGQQQLPNVQRNEPPANQPLPLPELHEDSNHNLAPIPVTIKREPEELDQLYLDDGKSTADVEVCVQPF